MQSNNDQPVFVIEACQNCKQYDVHARLDEQKYNEYFQKVSQAIVGRIPNATVMRNQIPKSYLPYDLYCNLIPNNDPECSTFMQLPRMWSFEVSYKGMLIFSKLLSRQWPNSELVATRASSIIDADANGEDVSPFLASGAKARSSSPSKKSPSKKAAGGVTPTKQKQEQPVKPFKLDESQKFLQPAEEEQNVAQPVKATQEQPSAQDTEIQTVNGKLVVTKHSAANCVKKIQDIKGKFPDNCMAQAFDEAYYNSLSEEQQIRLLTCCLSGVANPDSCMGCYAMNPKDYDEFSPFFKKALAQYHKVDLNKKKHVNNWSFKGVEGLPSDGVLDLTKLGLPALSMRVRTGRNLNKYPLPGAMTKDDRVNMEKDMKKVYDTLIADPRYGGKYVSITPGHECFINQQEYNEYVKAHIMFKDMSVDSYLLAAGIAGDWPHGRGCYVSEDKGFIIWNGEEDHLRIMCMKKGKILNEVFERLEVAVQVVQDNIDGGCAVSPDYGVVTSCPTNIGTGMRASVHIALPHLTADGTDTKAKAVARPLGLSVRGLGGEHTPIGADGTVDISPSARFCISEAEIVTALYKGIKLLKEQEDALAPKTKEFQPKTQNGKLIVDLESAPACVNKILEIKAQQPDNCMAQAFDEAYYNTLNDDQKIRLLTCCLSGVANPDSCMGCYAMNPKDYDEFSPFFKKALAQYHKVDLSVKSHKNNWSLQGVAGLPEDGQLDLTKLGLPALSMRVRTGRNLNKYPLPGAMTKDDRVNMEKDMKKVYDVLIADPNYGGKYVSITPGHECFINEQEYNQYVKDHIMFKDMSADSYLLSAGIAGDWPYGRGCYVSEDRGFIIWNGEEDHLRIMCMKKGTLLNEVFDRLETAVKVVQENIEGGCAMSADYGVVTSCPTNIGTGMRASVHIALPNLTADGTDAKAKQVARPLGLSVRGLGGEHTPIGADGTVDISPSARFCISEAEIVTALYLGIKLLKEEEDKAAPQ